MHYIRRNGHAHILHEKSFRTDVISKIWCPVLYYIPPCSYVNVAGHTLCALISGIRLCWPAYTSSGTITPCITYDCIFYIPSRPTAPINYVFFSAENIERFLCGLYSSPFRNDVTFIIFVTRIDEKACLSTRINSKPSVLAIA